jgi:hypothetical protein
MGIIKALPDQQQQFSTFEIMEKVATMEYAEVIFSELGFMIEINLNVLANKLPVADRLLYKLDRQSKDIAIT